MARILFAPLSIIGGLLAGFVGTKLFEFIWGRFDDQEPPEPEDRETTWLKLGIALLFRVRSSGSSGEPSTTARAGRFSARDAHLARLRQSPDPKPDPAGNL